MMKRIIWLTLVILLVSNIMADTCDPTYLNDNIVFHWNFTEPGFPYTDGVENYPLNNGVAPTRTTGVANYTYSQQFDGTSDYMYGAYNVNLTNVVNYTINLYVNTNTISGVAYQIPFGAAYKTGANLLYGGYLRLNVPSTDKFVWENYCGQTSATRDVIVANLTTASASTWYYLSITHKNGATPNIYINVTNETTVQENNCKGISWNNPNTFITIGDTYWSSSFLGWLWDGKITGVSYFKVALNDTCLKYTMNYSYPYAFIPTENVSLVVNLESPANNARNNTSPIPFYYNVTSTNTSMECNISFNNTVNQTNTTVPNGTTVAFWVDFTQDVIVLWNITCKAGNITASSETRTFTYDNSQPFITVNYPAIDNTTRFTTNRTLKFNASTQDAYLFQTNLTIKNSTGEVLYTEYVADNSPNTTRTWNQSVDMSTWPVGKYYVSFEASDSHTANKIKDFKPVKDDKERQINYETPEEWGKIKFDIKLKDSEQELQEFFDVKKIDRHSAVYKFKNKGDERLKYTFTVSADYPCKQMWDSDYNAHITCSNGMTGIWFDANFADKEALYNVIRINDYEFDIEIWTIADEIAFDSLGGLNYNSVDLSFIIQTNITVKINDTASGTFLSNFTATIGNQTLYANNTNNVTFWLDSENNYTISGTKTGFFVLTDTFYLNKTPIVVVLNATSAGVFLQFYDEITQSKLVGTTIYVEIISTTGNTSQTHNTNTGEQLITGLAFGEYEIRYYATNYYTRTYYATLNTSATQNIDLYLLNTTVGVRVIHTLLDQDSNPAVNIRIKLLRNYVSGATSEFKTVQMAQTNFEGQAVLYVELYDVWYKLIYTDISGNVIKETDPTPFLSIDTQDVLNLRTDLYEGWRRYSNTLYNLDNITVGNVSYFRFTYTDTQNLVREGCLRVDLINSDGLENICYNCTLSTAATLTCRYDSSRIGNYKAVALIDTNTPNSFHILNTIWVIIKEDAPQLLQEGIFFSLIIIGSLAFMGLATITGSVILMFIGIVAVSVVGFISGFHIGWLYFLAVFVFMMIYMVRRGKE